MQPVATEPRAAQNTTPAVPVHRPPAVEAAEPPRNRRRLLVVLLSGALGAVLLAVMVWRVDPGAAAAAAGRIAWLPFAAVLLINVPCTLLRALRSRQLVARLGVTVSMTTMTTTHLAGQVTSWVTPAAVGDLVRPYMWRRSDRVPLRDGVSAVLYERIVSFFLLCAIGGPLAALLAPLGGKTRLVVIAAAVILLLVAFVAVAGGRAPAGIVRRLPARLRAALVTLRTLIADPWVAAVFTALTVAIFVLSGLQILLLAAGLGHPTALWVAVAAYCLSQAAGSLSTLPFGLGVTDAVVLGLLVAAGLDAPTATATMLLTRVAVTLPLGIAGAAAYVAVARAQRARA